MHRATREKSYLGVTIKVRRLYMAFKMSQLFSVHDGDMLGGVLNKKYVQKNAGSAFWKEIMCATRFSTSWVAHLRMTERNTTKRGYAIWKRKQDQCQLRRWLEKWCRFCFQTWYFCEEGVYKVYDKKVWNPIYCSLSWWITSAISRWTGWHTHKSTTKSRDKVSFSFTQGVPVYS